MIARQILYDPDHSEHSLLICLLDTFVDSLNAAALRNLDQELITTPNVPEFPEIKSWAHLKFKQAKDLVQFLPSILRSFLQLGNKKNQTTKKKNSRLRTKIKKQKQHFLLLLWFCSCFVSLGVLKPEALPLMQRCILVHENKKQEPLQSITEAQVKINK